MNNDSYNKKSGFTLVEIVVVMGIILILVGVSTLNLFSLQNNTNLGTSMNTLISDIKQQQLKAMMGDTEGLNLSDNSMGIHFNTSSYVLFHGSTYSANSSSNYVVTLTTGLVFDTTHSAKFPNNEIVFSQINGNINGFTTGSDSVILKNTSNNQQKSMKFNRYGAVIQIN